MVSYYLSSNTGDREKNEDNVGMYQEGAGYCFVLADGLGGHDSGEVASRLAVEAAVQTFAVRGTEDDVLEESFRAAQHAILENQKADVRAQDMKTTLVILHVREDSFRWGHIGDSRLYYFQDHRLLRQTLDHSVPQMLVAAGQLRASRIRNHPDRNRLLRVLGVDWEGPGYQTEWAMERKGTQQFLLCTDGFWELIDEKKMTHCLKKSKSPKEWLDRMEEIVRKNGQGKNMDNYSAITVWLE